MGKLLFVNTNRINGIFGVVICLAVTAWGVSNVVGSEYFSGIALAAVGLSGGYLCLKLATQRTELYEQGFASKNIFGGGISGRYADLQAIARTAVSRNAVLNTDIVFVTRSGKRLVIHDEHLGSNDKKMELLLERSCEALTEIWAKNLEKQTEVVWLTNGKDPLLKIRKDGVLVESTPGSQGWIPLNQFRTKQAFGTRVEILNGDQKVLATDAGLRNYYVGLRLIEQLIGKQQNSMSATTRG